MKAAVSATRAADSGAVADENDSAADSDADPDLLSVIDAWPNLDDAQRAAIVCIVREARE